MEIDGNQEFMVEAIIRHRRRGSGWQYLIRWEGYGPEHDEWLKEDDLEHAKTVLKKYKAAHGLS